MDNNLHNRRIEFHEILKSLNSKDLYFQPPNNCKIDYPCIIYEIDSIDSDFADDRMYRNKRKYKVTLIDRDPDTELIDKILNIPMCYFVTHFVVNNLHHYIFNIYY